MQFITYFKIKNPNIVFETYDNEAVIINLDNGNYYSITDTAAEIFSYIEQGRSKDEILNGIINKYEGDNADMISSSESFLENLITEGLIIRDEKSIDNISSQYKETTPKENNQGRPLFVTPVLNRYTDMQDLLLLDPVHEVDEKGWPNPKPQDPDQEIKE